MGNAQECFQTRPIENVSEPMSDYINKCLENYQRNLGCDTVSLWDSVYEGLKIKLDTDTFKNIKSMDLVLQRGLLMESFGFTFYPLSQLDQGYENSIKLLEHWNACGLFEKIQKLFENDQFNDALNFESMKRIGTTIRISFKCDKKIYIMLEC